MKKELNLLLTGCLLVLIGCTEHGTPVKPKPETPQKGYARGRIVDSGGKPIANAEIVVNNSQYYNQNIVGRTDANGTYSLQLTPGSWYVRGTVKVNYNGRQSRFDLHPDHAGAFAGSAGAVCDLTWKLNGSRTGEFGDEGYYGGSVAVYPGGADRSFNLADVDITLEPISLVDGSKGSTVKGRAKPIGGGEDGLDDVPVGRYKVSARYTPNGKTMPVRIRNIDQAFASSIVADFSEVTQTRYKLTLEVKLP